MTLVWLPYAPERMGDLPDEFEYAVFDGDTPPEGIEKVEFWCLAYGFSQPYAEVLPRTRNLKVVQTQSAGVEHVQPFVPEGVTLCNARGVHDAATAEMGVALILASLRDIPGSARAQEHGDWRHDGVRPALADQRVLIVGYGSIGAALERRLDGFECDVVRVARTAREGVHATDELPSLLPDADVVVMLTPLNEATRHLVGAEFLSHMKDGALVVNLARGGIVDTDALLVELERGRLHAALDVTEPEPLPADHPLWRAPGTLITPHIAGGTTAMEPRINRLVRGQLRRFADGEELLNRV